MMIDKKLQAELRAKFNPDGSELRRRQLRMLDMLKYIDKVCQEQNIKYWLSSGTCLGAVRHGGFIPWDDDIDIEMLEEDYNHLITYLQNNETEEFVVQTHITDPNYITDFAKLRDKTTLIHEAFGIDKLYKYQGLFIDIFKLTPSNSQSLHYVCGRLRILESYCKRWSITNKIGKSLFPILRKINNNIITLCKPLDKLGAKNKLRHGLGSVFLKPRFKEDIASLTRIPFEDTLLPIPTNYDSYLRRIYGNYMELKITHQHLCPFEE
ncbi:MAG: LicD family protein [Bacteroides sp.]|nr:LicD family protein [Bacteroides sp.]